MADRFDGLFMNVAQQCQGIDGLFDSFFGFLQRRTDFYAASDEKIARETTTKAFEKYLNIYQKAKLEKAAAGAKAAEARAAQTKATKTEAAEKKIVQEDKIIDLDEIKEKEADNKQEKQSEGEVNTAEQGLDPSEGNGGTTEHYTWTQTLSTVEVLVPLKEKTTSRNLKINIGTSSISVSVQQKVLFQGPLFEKVKTEDSMWSLVDGNTIHITLEKMKGLNWWPCVVQGDPKIDLQKINPENSKLGDLDSETRATVDKMMFDQQQKMAGKPTSDQLKQHEMLEKFKKAHPEMDFSNAKINFGN